MLPEELLNEDHVEPETIRQLFPGMTDLEVEKLMVISVLRTTRAAYEDMDVFENVCYVLNDVSPDPMKTEGCPPEFIWKAIETIKKIYPTVEFSEEILQYIKFAFIDNGYKFFPEDIGLPNLELEDIKTLAMHGPFPLEETPTGIQAIKYLKLTTNETK